MLFRKFEDSMAAFEKLTRLKLPSQFSFSTATSLLTKWNHREVSLVIGSAFLVVLFLSSVFYYSRSKHASSPPEKQPQNNPDNSKEPKSPDLKTHASKSPSIDTLPEVTEDLTKRILSKSVRNFIVNFDGKKAEMEVHVSLGDTPTLLWKGLKIQGSTTEVALDGSLTPRQKFWLSAEAARLLMQYSNRYPLPKVGNKQEYADTDFGVAMETNHPVVMDIVWRLGLAPESTHETLKAVLEAINPNRYKKFKLFESLTNNPEATRSDISQNSENAQFFMQLQMEAVKLLTPEEIQILMQLQSNPQKEHTPKEAQLLKKVGVNTMLAFFESTPFNLTPQVMQETNGKVERILKTVTDQQSLVFLPSSCIFNVAFQGDKFPKGVAKELEMWAKSYEMASLPPPPMEQQKEVSEKEPDSRSITEQQLRKPPTKDLPTPISSNSSSTTKKTEHLFNEYFSPVLDSEKQEVKKNETNRVTPKQKVKRSPKKVTVPEGLVSGDHTDPKFIIHYDGREAWMKISKKGNQLTLEGLYRRTKKESGIEISDVVVADDPNLTPIQKFFLYDYAMYTIYKYGYSFPVRQTEGDYFSVKLDTKPQIQVNSLEEAALYSHFSFGPQSLKDKMKILRDACTEEIAQKIAVLDKKWEQKQPGIGDQVDLKKQLGLELTAFTQDEKSYLQEYIPLEDASELWQQYWSLLRKESYPQIAEYLNKEEPPQHHIRTTDELKKITWVDIQTAQKYEASFNGRIGWSTEFIEWPQEEGILRIAIETHPAKKQIKMVGLEIQGEDQQWQPVSTHPDLEPGLKFSLYRNAVAEMYAKEKGRLPLFKAHNEQELHIFYHLRFIPSKFKDALKDTPLLMKVRSIFAENKAFPLELVPFRKDYFQNWVKFQDPEFDGKVFGETLLSDYNLLSILSLSPVITFQEQKGDLYTFTVACCDSAGKPVTVQMELRCSKSNRCAIIEKVAGLNIKEIDSSAQILSSILYIAMQKSFEWNLKGAVKVRFLSKENSVFFQLIQFHNPETTNRHMKQTDAHLVFKKDGTPTKKW